MIAVLLANIGASKYITPEEMFSLQNSAFVDVRTADFANIGHLKGSIHIPADQFKAQRVESEFQGYDSIAIYCMRSMQRAENAYETAKKIFPDKQVFIVKGGIMAIAYSFPDRIEQ